MFDTFQLTNQPRPRNVEIMIDQWPDAPEEPDRVRKGGVAIEGFFIDPPRMDEEEPRIARRLKRVYREAGGFRADGPEHVAQRLDHAFLLAFASMKAGEDEKLHYSSVAPAKPAQTS
ncbi:MAG TPA: hypothetical protein VG274_11535 [Rhizomicrobium sp.]|nr:hypothetical protein [Rhizomicrobium sp.]